MKPITGRITKKLDGSYLIDQGYGPATYHATESGTPEQFQAADEYAKANPDMVDLEQAPTPADLEAQAKESERQSILMRLAEIDREAVRPMRAMIAGFGTDDDKYKLKELDSEAMALRARL